MIFGKVRPSFDPGQLPVQKPPHYHAPDHRKLLKPEAIWEIERGLSFTGQQLHAASVLRTSWFKKYMKLLETYDAIILPSTQIWPFKANLAHPSHINAQP